MQIITFCLTFYTASKLFFFFFGIWVVQQVSEHLTGIHKLNYAVKHLVILIQLCCFVEMEKENV